MGGKLVRGVLVTLGQGVAILLITAALCEVGFRVFNAVSPTFFFPSSSGNRFRGRPGADDWDTRLNSRGFKDLEFSPRKAAGTCRILGIGDSFVFATVPYRYNFLTVLEGALNAGGGSFEVINMGIPGTSPKNYVAVLGTEGLPLQPDLALCFFFIGNDFTEEQPAAGGFSSYLLAFLRYAFKIAPAFTGIQVHGKGAYQDDRPSMDRDAFMRIEKARSVVFRKANPQLPAQLEGAAGHLEKMQRMCAAAGVPFALVLIPAEVQVSRELQGELLRELAPLRAADFDLEAPNRLLRERLQRAGIPYLDLLADFTRAARARRLYLPRNTHWNIAGNALAAERIDAWLHSSGLLSRCSQR